MLPEQQQRILGYFIEEARDHLNTIEQGLLNLQSTLNDPEMINEVFRAAHSIKGGAAMLGLSSIQHTSHRLEDCFKVLKENPIQVDQKLESLFLGVSDTLKALLENLSGPFGLSEETANTLMSETEPVFRWLNEHLELLLQQGNSNLPITEIQPVATENPSTITALFLQRDFSGVEAETQPAASEISASTVPQQKQSKASLGEFQAQVLQVLREMLQLFKQKTTPETRQNLRECCDQLVKFGEALNLTNWCSLCQATANAIANPENTYLILAKTVITEIKQAQELVLKGKDSQIAISQQLEVLLGFPEIELLEIGQSAAPESSLTDKSAATEIANQDHSATTDDFITDTQNSINSLFERSPQLNLEADTQPPEENTAETASFLNSLSGEQNDVPLVQSSMDSKGPEVGIAELNTLADLFEGETPELDETWQQEEILDITTANELGFDLSSDSDDADSDLDDLLSFDEDTNSDEQQISSDVTADLSRLFGDNFLEKETQENLEPGSTKIFELNNASDETLRELSQTSHETWQFPVEIASQDVVEDLLALELDDYQPPLIDDALQFPVEIASQDVVEDLLALELDDYQPPLTEEVNLLETESIASVELSANQQNSFDDLFSATANANPVEEITPSKNLELNLNPSQKEISSLDNLFSELEENTSQSIDESEIGDLFDTLPPRTTFLDTIDDQGNFWNELNTTEQEQALALDLVIEQDVAKELEESLFSSAAADDFFDDSQYPELELIVTSSTPSFELEDFDISSSELEPQLDLIFTSDSEDDLFGDLTSSHSKISPNVSNDEVSVEEILSNSTPGGLLQTSNPSTTQPPEALDFIPEFTHQPLESESVAAFQSLSNQEIDLFDTFEENIVTDNSTYIQLDIIETELDSNLPTVIDVVELDLIDELSEIATSESKESLTIPEIINSKLDDNPEIAIDVTESNIIDSAGLDLVDGLLVDENADIDALKQEDLSTDTTNDSIKNAAITENLVVAANSGEETEFLLPELAEVENSTDPKDTNLSISEEENNVAIAAELEVTSTATPSEATTSEANNYVEDEFADLEALLEEELGPVPKATSIQEEDFAALEALLGGDNKEETPIASTPVYSQKFKPATPQKNANKVVASIELGDEFGDLEKLLAEADQTISHSPTVKSNTSKIPRPSTRRAGRFEETMKVPVKQLDDMSNLVGELVVNRNTLEQDHERLRQSLDNLLIQVQQLSDVGARMQELYERSLLEASLLASRKHKDQTPSPPDSNADRGFSELEMDRFTPFHTLSQEMIEMIVRVRESASDIDFVTEETERVARQFRQVTTQLQEGLTRARMVPFSQAIDRLRRGVRDNAIKYGKQVELVIEGGDTLIDKMILDHLTDPLTHMLNNAIAHGVETPEVRQAAGKSPTGEITIRAFHQGNQTVISVGDDGAGIDPEQVKAKALKLGMITANEARSMTRVDVYDLLFQAGFSIKDQADEISGRGVGMDVVRSEISEIRGTVNTDSALGKGTTFTIRLPLTLSICKALCCVSDKARIAFPMDGVEDTLDIPVKNIQHNADGQSFISWRDTTLPFRPLKELLAFNRHITRGNVYGGNRDDDMVSVVVVRSANSLIALQIDLVLSEQEIVIKQFEGPAPKPIGVAGATVLGDGRIMPIADVLEIMDIFQGRISKQSSSSSWQQKNTPTDTPTVKIDPTVLIVDDSITVRELLSLTFNKAGYRVEQARDGQEAWDKLRSGLPCDIVFCDIEMPRCDGLELLSRIQKDSSLNHLPIAMLTSRGADKHRQMAIQLGASGYFTKPYLEEALLEAAVRMLKGEKLV
ncbi:MAG: response regulator [Goleter apudmare HA4340-LM2]|jgi:chemosensory pili system protein ChpA (sensor histidine kinase/response regulator)|nr:response regulator [Goleter apudmare HA4340-LM2]